MKQKLSTPIEEHDLQASFNRVLKKIHIEVLPVLNTRKAMLQKLILPIGVLVTAIGFTGYYARAVPPQPASITDQSRSTPIYPVEVIRQELLNVPGTTETGTPKDIEVQKPARKPVSKAKILHTNETVFPETMTLEYE